MSLHERIVDRAPASIANLTRATERFGAQVGIAAHGPEAILLVGSVAAEKEVLARSIHDSSERLDQPFIRVDCRSWGRRAFIERKSLGDAAVGPKFSTPGLIRATNGGTLFLENIDELPTPIQNELFRTLSQQRIEAAPEDQPTAVDIVTIASVDAYFADRDPDECAVVRVPISLLTSYLSCLDLVWTKSSAERTIAFHADQWRVSQGCLSLDGLWSAGARLIHSMQPSGLRAWYRAWTATNRQL